jgi:hypothetical protein
VIRFESLFTATERRRYNPLLPVRSAASTHEREEKDRPDDGYENRAKTAEAVREEGKHLRDIAPDSFGGLLNPPARRGLLSQSASPLS